ncbi:MAG: ATP-binding protein [Deltaproteobacteria bacterium]|nr:ATP-binding protein [Deltaproteobacteria bacterium]
MLTNNWDDFGGAQAVVDAISFTGESLPKDAFWSERRAVEAQLEYLNEIITRTTLTPTAGPSGVGKSITLRRFAGSLDDNKYAVYTVPSPPATVHGFLRLLCRRFGLSMKHYNVDLFHAAQSFLKGHEQEHGTHPLLIVDDAEGLYPDVADVLRRLVEVLAPTAPPHAAI